jgi:hypothetical protein
MAAEETHIVVVWEDALSHLGECHRLGTVNTEGGTFYWAEVDELPPAEAVTAQAPAGSPAYLFVHAPATDAMHLEPVGDDEKYWNAYERLMGPGALLADPETVGDIWVIVPTLEGTHAPRFDLQNLYAAKEQITSCVAILTYWIDEHECPHYAAGNSEANSIRDDGYGDRRELHYLRDLRPIAQGLTCHGHAFAAMPRWNRSARTWWFEIDDHEGHHEVGE